ncbi:MAG: type II secretion system F family protein [Haloarculaceae archaeon]
MVSLLGLLPILVAAALVAIIPLASVSESLDRRLSSISRWLFGRYVQGDAPERERMLRAAYVQETYRAYAARSYFYATLAALAGGIVSVYAVGVAMESLGAVGDLLGQLPRPMGPTFDALFNDVALPTGQLLAVVLGAGVIGGGTLAGLTYLYRWQQPKSVIEVRRRGINRTLPAAVAFVYALSRGGMEVPAVLRILERNRDVYGDTAEEFAIAAREMDLFGNDVVTAIDRMADRTPSDQFKTFAENFSSVLQSGQSLTEFLREQYERYQEEAEQRQEEVLELLATIAEGYVTVLVAGVLFLITILLVFGLTTSNTLGMLKLLAYLFVPLANVGFVVYLDQQLSLLGISHSSSVGNLREELSTVVRPTSIQSPRADGGTTRHHAASRQLRVYDRLKRIKDVARNPLRALLWNPRSVLYVTVPLAIVWLAIRLPHAFAADRVAVRVLDDVLVQTALFLLGTFAVVWAIYRRRIQRIENATPELLERLASLNEAGLSVVESFEQVRETDLGVLSEEVDRVWLDVTFGANVQDALRRFGLRLKTAAITRAVTLVTNAMESSGTLGPVLRIAATQARADVELRRQRRQQMLTYLVVIYISFLVFLVIIAAVQQVLVPSLPNNLPSSGGQAGSAIGGAASAFTRLGQVDKPAYTLVFFHTALIQAVCSGFVAGQLGEGTLKDGTKHAAVMLGIAYLAFVVLSAPVASLNFTDQTAREEVVVDDVSLSTGGYVVVRLGEPDGEVLGHSDYLAPGTHTQVTVALDEPLTQDAQLYAVPHLDTNGNEQFDFAGGETDHPYPSKITTTADPARITASGDRQAALGRPGVSRSVSGSTAFTSGRLVSGSTAFAVGSSPADGPTGVAAGSLP